MFFCSSLKFVETDPTAQIINYKKPEEHEAVKHKEKKTLEEFFNYIYLNDGKLEDWAQDRIKSNPNLKQYYANIQHLKFFKKIQGLGNDLEQIEELIKALTTNKMFPGTTVDVYQNGRKLASLDLFIFYNYISKSSKAMQTYFNLEDETDPKLFGKESEYYTLLKQGERIVNLDGASFGVEFVKGSQDQVEICPFLGPEEEGLAITELIIPKQIEFNGKEVSITGVFGEHSFVTAQNFKLFPLCQRHFALESERFIYNCISLKEVNIPKNLKFTADLDAFKNCPTNPMDEYEDEDDYD